MPDKSAKKVSLIFQLYFVGIASACIFVFARNFWNDFQSWKDLAVNVPIDSSRWEILDTEATGREPTSLRATEELNQAVHRGERSEFHMRLRISPEEGAQVLELEAFNFLLGWVSGDFQVFFNGEKLYTAGVRDRKPHAFSIPRASLKKEENVMELFVKIPAGATEAFPLSRGFKEGFMTEPVAAHFERFYDFIEKAKSFALFWIYFSAGLFFAFLWLAHRSHREYFYFSAFALLNSFPEIFFGSAFSYNINQAIAVPVFTIWVFAKVGLALSFGFSLARLSKKWIEIPALVSVTIGVLVLLSIPPEVISPIRRMLLQTLLPISFFLGALACFYQFHRFSRGMSSARRRQLVSICILLLLLAFMSFIQFKTSMSTVNKELLWGVPEMILFVTIGGFALLSYRKTARLLARIPVSKYHRMPDLPGRIDGILLRFDIKRSESLYKDESNEGLVSQIMDRYWAEAEACGGVVLGHNGDEMDVFFDGKDELQLFGQGLELLKRYVRLGSSLQDELKLNGPVCIRTAMVKASLRPVWTGSKVNRAPAWIQVGERKCYVVAARLLDFEKKYVAPEKSGVVVDLENLSSDQLEFLKVKMTQNDFSVIEASVQEEGKHGVLYRAMIAGPAVPASKQRAS